MRTRSLCLIFVLGVILFAVVDGRGGRGGGSRGGSRGSSSRGSSSRGSSSRGSTSSSSQSSRGTYEHRGSKGQSESKPKGTHPYPKAPEPTNVKPSAPDFKESSRPSPSSPSQPAHNPNYPFGSGGQPGGQPAHNPNYPFGSGSQPAHNPNYPRPGAQPGVNQQPPPYQGAGSSQNLGNPPPYPGHGSGQNLDNPPPYPGHGSGQNLGNPPPYPGVNQPRPPPYDTQPLPPGPGFKPGVGNPPYPVQPGTGGQPYPRQPGGAPYPQRPGGAPYPQQPGGVPYPQRPGGGAPYPQQPGIGNPSHQGRVPYPQQPGGVYGNPPSYTQHSGFPLGGNPYTKPYKKKGLLGQVFSFGKKPKVHKPKSFGGGYGGYGASSSMPKAMYPMMPLLIKAKKPKFGSPFRSPSFIFMPLYMPGFHHHHHGHYYYDIENAEYRGRCRKPFKPDNSTMDCDTTSRGASCTVKCIENYHFSDNETSKTHQCWHVGGVWRPTRNFPKCEPTCKEECHNGGKCVRPEVCACDPEYRGEKCEHHVLNCDVRKFAGGNSNRISWVCQHTRNETKCRVKCRAGGHFAEEPQSMEYHCKINGEWTPDSIPNCIIEVKNATLPEMNNSTLPEMNNSTLSEEKNSTVSEEKNSTISEEKITTIPSLPAE